MKSWDSNDRLICLFFQGILDKYLLPENSPLGQRKSGRLLLRIFPIGELQNRSDIRGKYSETERSRWSQRLLSVRSESSVYYL
jgi:hypothetical protein